MFNFLLKKIPLKKVIIVILGVGILMVLIVFIITSKIIGNDVYRLCQESQNKYQGDCVVSLSAFLEDESNGFRERNSAIWALGQLGDSRALGLLEKYYTGNIPQKEPLDQAISQYELKKAINLTSGGINITHLIWKL